jgi:flagellin-like protein
LRKRDSKGVSEIVATVLMIMIVTAIGFAIFLYGMGFFTASTSARDQATQTGIATLRERFIVVDTYFNITDDTVSVWVYNYGETNIRISSVYLNGSMLNIDSPAQPVFITPTDVTKIVCNTTLVSAGDSQLVRIVSSLGNFYENYYES